MDKENLYRLLNSRSRSRYDMLIAFMPVLFALGLTLLTGYSWRYGLSCWFTIGAGLTAYAWYSRPESQAHVGDQLRQLISSWVGLVSDILVGQRLVFFDVKGNCEIAIMNWNERVLSDTAYSFRFGGLFKWGRVYSRDRRLKHFSVKECVIDYDTGDVYTKLTDGYFNHPGFSDPLNALEFLREVRRGEKSCWPALERIVQRDRIRLREDGDADLVRLPIAQIARNQ